MLPGSIAANKTNSFDGWVVTNGIYSGCCTMNNIQDAGRKLGRRNHFREQLRVAALRKNNGSFPISGDEF